MKSIVDKLVSRIDAIEQGGSTSGGNESGEVKEHTHTVEQITDLDTKLSGYASKEHTHKVEDITDLDTSSFVKNSEKVTDITNESGEGIPTEGAVVKYVKANSGSQIEKTFTNDDPILLILKITPNQINTFEGYVTISNQSNSWITYIKLVACGQYLVNPNIVNVHLTSSVNFEFDIVRWVDNDDVNYIAISKVGNTVYVNGITNTPIDIDPSNYEGGKYQNIHEILIDENYEYKMGSPNGYSSIRVSAVATYKTKK